MIIDMGKFIREERPFWDEMEGVLRDLEKKALRRMNINEAKRFHYLYERVSADLAEISTFASERETRNYLEALVARAYGEIHETREKPHRLRPMLWLFGVFPRTFRKHIRAFNLSLAVTCVGCMFGGAAIGLDWSAKEVLMPFPHLVVDPAERVAQEEKAHTDRLKGMKAQATAFYIKNNTSVSFMTMASGALWGVGTLILLFSNGVMLGAVATDYVLAGQAGFLAGWLLPHGALEIPAILLAGQAGFLLAGAVIGWGLKIPLGDRMRRISGDLVTIIMGVVIMLVWAGIVEAYLSQYHEPAIPYSFKIAVGLVELILLILFLVFAGRNNDGETEDIKNPDA
jgi:uncharacterized membrane protein SpoIIM required for sporulation